MAKTRSPGVALSLWWAISDDTKLKLNARAPLDAKLMGVGKSLIFAVGKGIPLQWIMLHVDEHDCIKCRMWSVGQKENKTLEEASLNSSDVNTLLQGWASKYRLGV